MPMKYCAQCGGELVTRMEAGRERPVCPACGYIVYRNPVPVGLVMATQGEELLLVHRRNAPLADYWAPPAGYIELDESLEQGSAREAKEETGLDVAVGRLIKAYSRANAGVILLAYEARVIGGTMSAAEDEVHAVKFFGRNDLPKQSHSRSGNVLDDWFYEVIQELFGLFTEMRV